MNSTVDVIVIGAGPAGLSAALVLGRCRRRVIVIDSGEYRNATSRAMNGFLLYVAGDASRDVQFAIVAAAEGAEAAAAINTALHSSELA